MRRLWRGMVLVLLVAAALPQASASGQSEPTPRTDSLVLARPADQVVEAPSGPLPPMQSAGGRTAQQVSSVLFVQAYSPFVWGRTSVGGLAVELSLEDAAGTVKGVPSQRFRAAPNDFVKVDRAQLYFETVFVDAVSRAPVPILPGDRVRVVTSGLDPATGSAATDDRRVTVDDVRAWTSYERDTVEGTAPARSTVIVTKASSLTVAGYVTPGTGLTYQQVTAGADGTFQVGAFRTSTDPTAKKLDLDQGTTGYVRVRHVDGSEVYAVHGQNVFALQSSPVVHGYSFRLPTAPGGLEANVAVSRPEPNVAVTHRGPGGEAKGNVLADVTGTTYAALLPSMILGGDSVEVSIWGAPAISVALPSLSASVDMAGSQVVGSAPAGANLTVAAGRIDGYVTSSSSFRYLEKSVTVGAGGTYSSGQFQCGASNHLSMQPGSFGYVGFEDARGNFVYKAFAAPSYHVMVDYPQVEGWVADGGAPVQVAVRDGGGAVRYEGSVQPLLAYLTTKKLYSNVFFQTPTTAFAAPGDVVTVSHPGRSASIAVSPLTAFVDTDGDTVTGQGSSGQSVRVIPAAERTTRRDVDVGADGKYRAGQPFRTVSTTTCAESDRALDFDPGDAGRVYVDAAGGDKLFAAYGRSIHVNLNENYLELYQFPTRDVDWAAVTPRTANVTVTPPNGAPTAAAVRADGGRVGKTRVTLTDPAGERVLLRAGDVVRAEFEEGPAGATRTVALDFTLPLVTGSPDLSNHTLAGVGPRGWSGRATLTGQSGASEPALSPNVHTAYPPVQFTRTATTIPLAQGYAGTVSFSDGGGRRIWAAWAVTAYPVKIVGSLRPGDTSVCGTAPPGSTVRVRDVSSSTAAVVVGSGTADDAGGFCATVTALVKDQVVVAEAEGIYSQPTVIGGGNRVLISLATR